MYAELHPFKADLSTCPLLDKMQNSTILMKKLIYLPLTFCKVFSKLVHILHIQLTVLM